MTLEQTFKIFNTIFESVFFAVLLFFFLVIVSPLLPTKAYIATFAVVSGSMEPSLPIGSLAFVQHKDTSQLKVGDVITFPEPNNPKRTIIHRITNINGSGGMMNVTTKGDNNSQEDQWRINAQNISGQMIKSIPYIGFPIMFAQTPTGYAILVGIPALILSIINIKNIIEGILEEIKKRSNNTKVLSAY